MINEIGMMVVAAVVGQLVIGIMTVVGGYRLLAQRIDQQEEIMKSTLNNGIRSDISKLHLKIDKYIRELVALQATCDERHNGRGDGQRLRDPALPADGGAGRHAGSVARAAAGERDPVGNDAAFSGDADGER